MTHLTALIERKHRTCALVVIAFSIAVLPAMVAFATRPSPIGEWETISDVTGEATAIVQITLENGELVGKIDKLIREPGQDPNPLCNACPGEKKDQPVQGLTILWGLEKGDDNWDGGFILDPDNGRTYRSELRVTDNNEKLEVRGYIGFSLFGRTQVWIRKK